MSRKTKKATDEKAEKESRAKAQLEELILNGLQMPGLTFGINPFELLLNCFR